VKQLNTGKLAPDYRSVFHDACSAGNRFLVFHFDIRKLQNKNMARKRMIDPEFWSDEKIANLSPHARLLFIGMWNFADDTGIIKSRPEYLKSAIFGYDDFENKEILAWIREIESQNFIFSYIINGQHFSIILNFLKHQVINKPTPSKLPKPSIQNRKYQNSIFLRDNYVCHICGEYLKDNTVLQNTLENMPSVDHIIPRSKGGNDLPNNLKTACLKCNKSRGNKELPESYYTPTEEVNECSRPKRKEDKINEDKEKRREDNICDASVADKKADRVLSPVEQIMDIFYKINPTLNWGNKTTRKACQEMINKFGLEPTLKMAEQIISIQGQPFAPVATTPYQMKEKLANFKVYFDSKKNKTKIIEIV